jgi:hypothetical protein
MRKHELADLKHVLLRVPILYMDGKSCVYIQDPREGLLPCTPAFLLERVASIHSLLENIIERAESAPEPNPSPEKPVKEEKPQPKATPAPKKEKPAEATSEAQKPYIVKDEAKGQKMATCPKGGPSPGDKLALSFCKPKPCYPECKAWQK